MKDVRVVCALAEKSLGRKSGATVLSTDMRFDDLGLDSLDRAGMLIDLERHYKIDVPDELCARIETVADMVQCIKDIKGGIEFKNILRKKHGRSIAKIPTAMGNYIVHQGVVYCRANGQPCAMQIDPYSQTWPNVCKMVKCALEKQR